MPRRDGHDHALLLLSKARTDKLVLDKQAVEKLLKAVLGCQIERSAQTFSQDMVYRQHSASNEAS